MSSDDSDDSDGSEDIGNMLKHAHEVKLQQASQSDKEDDDDDDDDTSSVELLTPKHSTARKRKASASKASTRLRKRSANVKHSSNASDDAKEKSFEDFMDEEEDSDNDKQKRESAKNVVNLVKTGPVISVDDSSDDDDNERSPSKRTCEASRPRPEDLAALQKIQQANMAMMNLYRANNRDVIQDIEREAVARSFSNQPSTTIGTNDYLRLTVCPRFDDKHASTKATLPEQVFIDILSDKTVENLMDSFFQLAKLNKEKFTVGLKFGGNLLDPKKHLYKIKNLQYNSEFDAIVYLSTIVVHRSGGNNVEGGPNLGKAITVKVRNGKQEDLLQIHMKETFQVLVDKYRALKKLAKSKKIVLEFDGEPLALGDTPQNQDMEDEDMIDVRV